MRAKDFKESWNRGQELERKFYEILKLRDKNARQATPQEQYKHIDFLPTLEQSMLRVKRELAEPMLMSKIPSCGLNIKTYKVEMVGSYLPLLIYLRSSGMMTLFSSNVKSFNKWLTNFAI